ncbi:MAG: glycosyltransferase N-terminal domain-containing protein [Bacteroidota bacterium]|nr:glycosyltransferase N-terminal domain-containing protein [Bacteroidota bacterium]
MSFLYNISIYLYHFGIFLSSFFNAKARSWIQGRKHLFKKLAALDLKKKPLIWIHCASLGEFEQGRPVIEGLRDKYPDHFLLLTFFSPSGFEIKKDYDKVDHVAYLPIDTKHNAKTFLEILNPCLAIFVKYEFWFNYINGMAAQDIPVVVISANFRKDQHFFKWYGGWFRKGLGKINTIFVQRDDSKELLGSIGYEAVFVSGDTRFDRVASIVSAAEEINPVMQFKDGKTLLLAGSTWPKDEEIIMSVYPGLKDTMKLVLVPHEVHEERIRHLCGQLNFPFIKFSEVKDLQDHDAGILIIDSIGLLSRLYRYADISYIGGGFGVGIHNILEAAAFGKPVIFGPNYHKFKEAVELVDRGGAFSIENAAQLEDKITSLIKDEKGYQKAAEISSSYVLQNQGATTTILEQLDKIINNKA